MIEADPEVLYIQIEQFDPSNVRSLISMLKDEDVDELLILDECGVLDPEAKEAVFIVTDHINATGGNPLIGPNDEKAGPRFPDMTFAYSEKLTACLKNFLTSSSIPFTETILYGAEIPPSDPAELARLRSLNCTVRNKTVVWLDILARHAGIQVGAAVRTVG